jgi:hypothetical protein
MAKKISVSKSALLLAVISVLLYSVYLQFISPAFSEPDSYYHIAISNFIKQYGIRYPFTWAQFSIFKYAFSDKDLLFHLLTLPFLFLTDNLILAGKYAFVFYAASFILVYVFILKKYASDLLAAVLLILLFTSLTFASYLLQLRSMTLANTLIILGLYFLISKNR